MTEKSARDKLYQPAVARYIIVLVWLFLLFGYCLLTNRSAGPDNLGASKDFEVAASWLKSSVPKQVASKKTLHVLVLERRQGAGGEIRINFEENLEHVGHLVVDKDLYRFLDGNYGKSEIWRAIDALIRNEALASKVINLGAITTDIHLGPWQSKIELFMPWGTFILFFLALIGLLWSQGKYLPILTPVVIAAICLIHALLVWLQGGLFVSPMGNLAGGLLPILIAQTLFAVKRSTGSWGKALAYLPIGVFTVGHWIAHAYSYDGPTVRFLSEQFFKNLAVPGIESIDSYQAVYWAGVALGVITLITRRNEIKEEDGGGLVAATSGPPPAGVPPRA